MPSRLAHPHAADWRAANFSRAGGRGHDHFLRLRRDSTYFWAVLDDDERLCQGTGTWDLERSSGTIRFDPPPPHGYATYRIDLVTGMEDCNLMFLIRPIALCTPNLPLLFYVVGRPGEVETSPWWAYPDRPLDV